MFYRICEEGPLFITQPAHGWVAGQIARQWGNSQFQIPAPYEEVCLATSQQDSGWTSWELLPQIDKETGFPQNFNTIPFKFRFPIWQNSREYLTPQSLYAALLVSLHGTYLCESSQNKIETEVSLQEMNNFLESERTFQSKALHILKECPHYSLFCGAETIERNRLFLAFWDFLALFLCSTQDKSLSFEKVPLQYDTFTSITVTPVNETKFIIDPYPFKHPMTTLILEGRLLQQKTFHNLQLRYALEASRWKSIMITLEPK